MALAQICAMLSFAQACFFDQSSFRWDFFHFLDVQVMFVTWDYDLTCSVSSNLCETIFTLPYGSHPYSSGYFANPSWYKPMKLEYCANLSRFKPIKM